MHILLPYNALGNPNQKLVRSLLLLAVIASRVTRRSSMPRAMAGGSRSCEASVGFRPGPGAVSRRAVGCKVRSRCLYSHPRPVPPVDTPPRRVVPRAHSLTVTLSPTVLRCPGLPAARGSRAPDYGPVGPPGVDLSGSLGWRAGSGPSSGRAGTGGIARRHGHRHGAARCVRQPLFFLLLLPRGAAKGQGGQHAVGVMRRMLMASSSPLFLLLLCHDDELRV